MTKPCKHCRYARLERVERCALLEPLESRLGIVRFPMQVWHCMHPSAQIFIPWSNHVIREPVALSQLSCKDARQIRCGLQGRYWEPRS